MFNTVSGASTWNPDSRRDENSGRRGLLRRADLWFWVGILILAVLIYLVWQQKNSLLIADEITRLEARTEILRARILERGALVTRLRQPDRLLGGGLAEALEVRELNERVFLRADPMPEMYTSTEQAGAWQATINFRIPEVLAAEN